MKPILHLNLLYEYRGRIFERFFNFCGQILKSAEGIYQDLQKVSELEGGVKQLISGVSALTPKDYRKVLSLVRQQLNLLEHAIDLYLLILINIDSLLLKEEDEVKKNLKRMKSKEVKLLKSIGHRKCFKLSEDEFKKLEGQLADAKSDLHNKLEHAYNLLMEHLKKILERQYIEAKFEQRGVANLSLLLQAIDPRGPVVLKRKMKMKAIELTQLQKKIDSYNNITQIADFEAVFDHMLTDLDAIAHRDMRLVHYLEVALANVKSTFIGSKVLTNKLQERYEEVHEHYKDVFKKAVEIELKAKLDIVEPEPRVFELPSIKLPKPLKKKRNDDKANDDE